MTDSRRSSATAPSEHNRRARLFAASLLTVGVFGAMSLFGGMSYASQAFHHGSTPSHDEYCPTAGEPDHNGDIHSNCHTGKKHRGAGGEDKPGSKG